MYYRKQTTHSLAIISFISYQDNVKGTCIYFQSFNETFQEL